jgi:hypothetical protein
VSFLFCIMVKIVRRQIRREPGRSNAGERMGHAVRWAAYEKWVARHAAFKGSR